MTSIPRLHLISSRARGPANRLPEVARSAAAGGLDAVHIRERDLPARELLDMARAVQRALDGTGCKLFINDRVDVAAAVGADGVQLPEQGIPADEARKLLPIGALIGVSVHSVEGAVGAQALGADFVIAGHVFETGSKPGRAGRGLEFIRRVSRSVTIPVIAIGGITPENTSEVIRVGARGVAMLSGLLAADDPGGEARRVIEAIERVEVIINEG